MTIREKMARAIYECGGARSPSWDVVPAWVHAAFLAKADAALAALEEPTEAMVDAGDELLAGGEAHGHAWGIFRAMIGAAKGHHD